MALSIGEKIGAVFGFIPIASTVSGLIKAFVYFNRAKTKDRLNLENLEQTAKKTEQAGSNLHWFSQQEASYEKILWKASLFEMIPGVNLIAAVYSAYQLSKLSEVRNHRDFLIKGRYQGTYPHEI